MEQMLRISNLTWIKSKANFLNFFASIKDRMDAQEKTEEFKPNRVEYGFKQEEFRWLSKINYPKIDLTE